MEPLSSRRFVWGGCRYRDSRGRRLDGGPAWMFSRQKIRWQGSILLTGLLLAATGCGAESPITQPAGRFVRVGPALSAQQALLDPPAVCYNEIRVNTAHVAVPSAAAVWVGGHLVPFPESWVTTCSDVAWSGGHLYAVAGFAADPTVGNSLYRLDGSRWVRVPTAPAITGFQNLIAGAHSMYAVIQTGQVAPLARSTDGGRTWKSVNPPVPNPQQDGVEWVAMDPQGTLYAEVLRHMVGGVVQTSPVQLVGIFQSTDHGAHWTQLPRSFEYLPSDRPSPNAIAGPLPNAIGPLFTVQGGIFLDAGSHLYQLRNVETPYKPMPEWVLVASLPHLPRGTVGQFVTAADRVWVITSAGQLFLLSGNHYIPWPVPGSLRVNGITGGPGRGFGIFTAKGVYQWQGSLPPAIAGLWPPQ